MPVPKPKVEPEAVKRVEAGPRLGVKPVVKPVPKPKVEPEPVKRVEAAPRLGCDARDPTCWRHKPAKVEKMVE